MKVLCTLVFALLVSQICLAQKFDGQWKGGFADAHSAFSGFTSSNIDYVLELQTVKNEVSGYSYTYFSDGSKQYYTICKLKGTINRKTKEVMVTEYERTKSNTPPNFSNCFQTHLLKYKKISSDSEQLVGTWIPAPNQLGDCGSGQTFLYRKIFKKVIPDVVSTPKIKSTTHDKIPVTAHKPTITQPKKEITNTLPKKPIQSLPKKIVPDEKSVARDKRVADSIRERSLTVAPKTFKEEPMETHGDYQPRVKSLIKTLEIHQETITVEFYDNGAVDGDSITVFFNGKIVVSHLGLTEKPATFTLTVDKTLPYNELVMYAENMGTIPPNTALMVVKDGTKQYEVNITSDTERSGTIRFHYSGHP